MVKTTSLSSAAINALTTGDSSILYNNQSRDLVLYSGSLGFSQSGVFNLEINNINGECLKLKYNSSPTNYVDFNLTSTGQLNIIPNGSDKIINIYHHNGSTSGLSLGGTLITASATELNKLDGITATTTELNYVNTTQGIAEASKALIVDANRDISNIRNLQTENLTVNGTLVTSSATELNYNDITTIGTAEPGKALVADVNRDISNIRNLELTNNLTITNHNGINKGLILGNTLVSATASEINILDGVTATTTEINILDGVTATTTEINKLSGVTATTTEINKLAGITATTTELNYVDTTPGTVEASKAIIVDANRDISNIRNLQTENLTVNGTLITASASEINYNDLATIGTAEAGKALVVDLNRDISNIRNLTAANLTGSIQSASQTNITSVGTLTSLSSNGNVNIAQHNGSTTGLQLNSTLVTATANEINVLDGITSTTAELNILDGVTANANEINVLDGITATTTELNILDGVTATYAEINVLDGITATTAELNYVDTTPGTAEANKAIIVDSNKDISGINALSVTSLLVNGSSISTNGTTPPELSNITPGTASASKALVVDSNKDITSIRNLTATNLTGTLATAEQTNITSVGTLTGLTSSGAISITNTTASTNSTSGALVVSGGVGINGATNIGGALSVTGNITGTLATAAQTNITSVGTLTGLTSSGAISITNTTDSSNSTTGALVVSGGVGISKILYTNGIVRFDNTTESSSNSTGALVVNGGVGIRTHTNIGRSLTVGTVSLVGAYGNNVLGLQFRTAATAYTTSTSGTISACVFSSFSRPTFAAANVGTITTEASTVYIDNAPLAGSNMTITNAYALWINDGRTILKDNSTSTNSTSGALVVSGGVGIGGALNIGGSLSVTGNITGTLITASQPSITSVGTLTGLTSSGAISITNTTVSSSSSTGALIVSGGVGIGGSLNIGEALSVTGNITGTLITASQPSITSVGTLTGLTSSGAISITNTTASSSSSTGALVISGGVGIGGAVNTANSISINRASGDGFVHNVTGTNSITLKSSIDTANTWAQFGTSSNHELRLMTNGSSRIYISNTGAVTIPGSVSITSSGSLNVNGATTLNNVGIGGTLSVTGNITGTLATAAQTSITSVGTLTGLTSSGIVSITNTTDSTSSSTGALVMSGGIGINDTADAISSTNGGSLTTAGGMAIAKKLFVGTDASVGGNLTVTGNLTISGTTTTVNTTSTLIKDNTLTLNSGPAGTGYDSGVLIQRFQDENNAGTGDVVNDTAEETYAISSATSTTATLPSGANTTADYYKDWYIKITSGAGNNQVRKVIGYTGSTTRVLTLNTSFATTPSASDTINLYNKPISTILWQESNKQFITAFTSTDVSAGALSIIDYADLRTNSLIANRIRVGDSTDTNTTRMISALDSTITTGSTNRLIAIGKASSANNQAEMMFNWTADGSSSNNLRLGLHSAGTVNSTFILGNGNMGIGTSLPDRKLEINSSTGNCLRLTYNDTDGTATTYCDQTISSAGVVTLAAAGSAPSFVMSGGAVSITNTTGSTSKTTGALTVSGGLGVGGTVTANSLEVITTGSTIVELSGSASTLRLMAHTDNVCYIQTGDSSGTSNSSRDLFIGDFGKATSNLTSTNRRFIIKGGVVGTNADAGFVGIGTIVPSKQLEVRNATGDCLRLSYDDTDYFDTTVSSTGVTTWTATGSASRFTFAGTSLITLPDNTSFKLTSDIGASDYHLLHFNSSKVVCIGKNTVSNTSNWLEVAPAGGALFGGDVNIEGVLNVNGAANAYFGSNTTPILTTFIGGSGDVLTIDGTDSGTGGRNTILFKGNAYTWEFGTRNSTANPNNAMYFYSKKNDGTENAYRMIMLVDGKIGLGTTVPATQLEINSATGSCLQLTYNDSNGGATTYCRQEVSSTGVVTFTAAGSAPSFTMAGGALSITDTTASTSATTGALKVSGGAGISHLVIGGNRSLATWSTTGALFRTVATTLTDTSTVASGDAVWLVANVFATPTFAATNTNVTVGSGAVNLYVNGPPSQGTNMTFTRSYALYVNGNMYMGANKSIREWNMGIQLMTSGGLVTDAITATSGTISTFGRTYEFGRSIFAATNTSVTLTNAATVYIDNAPSNGTNMTITNAYALYAAAGKVRFADSTASSSTTTGALTVTGGVGIGGNSTIGGILSITNTTASTSYTTGALKVSGGVGIDGAIYSRLSNNLTGHVTFQRWTNDLATDINVDIEMSNTSVKFGTSSNTTFSLMTGDNSAMTISTTNQEINIFSNTSASSTLGNGALQITSGGLTVGRGISVGGSSSWVDGAYQVIGSFQHGGGSHEIQIQMAATTGDSFIGTKTSNKFCLMSNNSRAITIDTSQRVGIGISAPSALLELGTDSAKKPTTNTWTISSDIRVKEDIVQADVSICYNKIKNLQLKYFKWKDDFIVKHNVTDHHQLGWIAQDVEQFIPKAVEVSNNETYNISDFRSLNSSQIYANMFGAIQKLIQDKEALEAENQLLKHQIQSILQRLDNLENN